LNDAYPDGFGSWPVEDRNAFFAKAAQEYDKRKAPSAQQGKHNLIILSFRRRAPQRRFRQ
jgi:hypothetical protein